MPLLQGGYTKFIDLIEAPNYDEFSTKAYSINKDPLWKNDARKSKTELERIAFYHCDQVGTPQALSNEKGECVWKIVLNTWGKTEVIKAKDKTNPFEYSDIRFQGQYYDEETGLHYNRYRYYEPHSGRYISKDPIGLDGGLNNSAYVSDPNQWVDIEGLNPRRVQSPANQPQLINYHATSIINQIRQYNPQFSYGTISPSYTSARYNRRDIENLNAILKNYQSQKTCLPNSYWVNYNTNRPA